MSKKIIAAVMLFAALFTLNSCKGNEDSDSKKNDVSVTQTVSDTKESISVSDKNKSSLTSAVSESKTKTSGSESEQTVKNAGNNKTQSKSDAGIAADSSFDDKNELPVMGDSNKNNNKSEGSVTTNKSGHAVTDLTVQDNIQSNIQSATVNNKENDVIELPIVPIE